jgi:hypothetical protein
MISMKYTEINLNSHSRKAKASPEQLEQLQKQTEEKCGHLFFGEHRAPMLQRSSTWEISFQHTRLEARVQHGLALAKIGQNRLFQHGITNLKKLQHS